MNHKTTREHYEKYHQYYLVAPETFKAQAKTIMLNQAGDPKGDVKEILTRYYKVDPNLNNTFTHSFDKFPNYDCYYETNRHILKGVYESKGGFSLACSVCTIKHAMIYGILEATPEWKD